MASITTICLVGFPPDGVAPRELKNLCRFVPGFEGAHVAFAGVGIPSTLFVKFQTPDLATSAMELMHGVPFDLDSPQFTLKAEWARREMEVRPHAPLPSPAPPGVQPHYQQHGVGIPRPLITPPPPQSSYSHGAPPAAYSGPPSKRGPAGGEQIVTIVVFGLREKGLHQGDLERFFGERPGFVSMQMNDRIDALFVRYASGGHAEQALVEANNANIGAEWARRNLDDDLGIRNHGGGHGGGHPVHTIVQWTPPPAPAPAPAPYAPSYAGPPSRRGGSEQITTITVLGLAAKDMNIDQMQEWFTSRPGFDRQQLNDRIGGLFVKFSSVQEAEQALYEANQMNYGAEWARRNLDDDLSLRNSQQPSYQQSSYQQPSYQQHYQVPHHAPAPTWGGKGGGGGPPKRMRSVGGEIDTITILAVKEKEQTHGNLQQWFAERPGYVALQMNDKIGAMFVKFSSRSAAEQGMADANNATIGAEWAYRNLDL